MMFDAYKEECPTRQALDRIADKWTVLVIGLLADEPRRFSDLKRSIEGISQKMLTQTLRTLERDGLVSRTAYAEVPPRVVYELTPLGETLIDPIIAIRDWAYQSMDAVLKSQCEYDARSEVKRA
jgi:DNA-binding HxlR family transcriptional regulator